MGSRDPFNIAHSTSVAPIPCVGCGNNMHCILRRPVDLGERQTFKCVACTNAVERIVGLQVSDDEIQKLVERSVGIEGKSGDAV